MDVLGEAVLQNLSYEICGAPFVGCPGDADTYARRLREIYDGLLVPGAKPPLYFWRKSYDPVSTQSAEPDQFRIVRTSERRTNPVFVLFANIIGTPVRPPIEGWSDMRSWLDSNGFGFIVLLGKDFQDSSDIPLDRVPMSGTMYELFDAMRTGDATDLRIFDLHQIAQAPNELAPDIQSRQKSWCRQLMRALKTSFSVETPTTEQEFEHLAKLHLQAAFGVGQLDPRRGHDALPSLEALSADTPMLFGRSELIGRLTHRVFVECAPLTCVVGVSGVGKSSLLRAGLVRQWHDVNRYGEGAEYRATTIVVEPELLQLHPTQDPLKTLGRVLCGSPTTRQDRIVGPLPAPLRTEALSLRDASGDKVQDIATALNWWSALIKELNGPLVLILDQAEQIEAIARRAAETSGSDIAGAELSPAWYRFTALLLALVGELDERYLTPKISALIAECQTRVPLRLILGLHRETAIALWPFRRDQTGRSVISKQRVEVPALHDEKDWDEVLQGTCAAFGLTMAEDLLYAMRTEAASIARQKVDLSFSEADEAVASRYNDEVKYASVLPQVITALQRILLRWQEITLGRDILQEDMVLDFARYAEVAGIASSIEALGETAWTRWQERLAESSGSNLAGFYSRRDLEEQQVRRFTQLMSRLVDASITRKGSTQREVTYLRSDDSVAIEQAELVAALREQRLLTRIETRLPPWPSSLRLMHRSIIDHWSLARSWLDFATQRLATKADLRSRLTGHYSASPTSWPKEVLDDYSRLALNWIGSSQDEDGELRDTLHAGLLELLDPAQVAHDGETRLQRLPFNALIAGETEFAMALIDKCIASTELSRLAPFFAILFAQQGMQEQLVRLIASDGINPSDIADCDGPEGTFPLLLAAQNGYAVCVASLLSAGAAPDRICQTSGTFPLLMAAQNGHVACLKALLAAGAVSYRQTTNGGTPLLIAAQNDHYDCVKELLAAGAMTDPQHVDLGFILLLLAQNGQDEIMRLLLDYGAVFDFYDERTGLSPLIIASQAGHDTVVSLLLERGADLHASSISSGAFPLLMASQLGRTTVVELLLRSGADPNAIDTKEGRFPLLMAAQGGHAQVVSLLIAAGADPNLVDPKDGYVPLPLASAHGHEIVVSLLLEAGANPNKRGASNMSPLTVASHQGHAAVVRRLLDAGVDPNFIDEGEGSFPLLQAAQAGHLDIVRILIEGGADPNAANTVYDTFPLLQASQRGHEPIVRLLLDKGANPNRFAKDNNSPLLVSSRKGLDGIVRILLEGGGNPNIVNRNGVYPLLLAAKNGDVEVARIVLEKGADPNLRDAPGGFFPLLIASQEGHGEIVELLLAFGADVNSAHQNGSTPLSMASRLGHDQVVKLLLRASADLVSEHGSAASPLSMASAGGHEKIVDLLLNAGANPNAGAKEAGSPLLAASAAGHERTLKLLLASGADPNAVSRSNNLAFPLLVAASQGHLTCVRALLDTGADIDKRHLPSGRSAISFAMAGKYAEVVRFLAERGADLTDQAPEDLALIEKMLSGGVSVENDAHVEDEASEPGKDFQVILDVLAKARKLPPVFGAWEVLEPDKKVEESQLMALVQSVGLSGESMCIPGTCIIPNFGGLAADLRCGWIAYKEDNQRIYLFEFIWVDSRGAYEPVLVGPGVDFSGIVLDLDQRGRTRSGYDEDEKTLASLALLTKRPPEYALVSPEEFAAANRELLDRSGFRDESWNVWDLATGPEGRYVELPAVCENALVQRRVSVPTSASKIDVLDYKRIIADGVSHGLTQFFQQQDGSYLPFRIAAVLSS